MSFEIRAITDQNDAACAEIAALWSHYIETSVVTFNPVSKTAEDIAGMVQQKTAANEPVFAAHDGATFLGFATYGPFRNGEGYKFSKEHTIMLKPDLGRTGLGRAMMNALEDHAKAHDIQSLWAGITGENTGAIAFHSRLGFEHVSTIPQIGWKFDRWHDLVLMRKLI